MIDRTREQEDAHLRKRGHKADHDKENPLLLEKDFVHSLRMLVTVLEFGAKKYDVGAWKYVDGGIDRYDAAARRHRMLRDEGHVLDAESGLPHLVHEIISNMMQLELMISSNKIDPRMKYNEPPKEISNELLSI